MWFINKNKTIKEYSNEELSNMLNGSKAQRETAFTHIYNKFSNRLYAYCLRISDSKQDADDIFQETFTNFINSSKSHVELSNVGAYLIKIARNIELNNKRSKKKRMVNIDDLDIFPISDEKDRYEKKEEMEIISRALDLLDFNYREVFILRQYHNMDYEEISEITNENINVLRNRYFRAKAKLKEILEPILNEKIN